MLTKEDFPKYERICKDNEITALFNDGEGISVYPYRVVFLFKPNVNERVTCRLLLSVSKKRFHHAFKRNRVKRLIRESWRKNKAELYETCERNNISVDVALVYTATVIHSYDEMMNKTGKAIHEIVKHHETHQTMAN